MAPIPTIIVYGYGQARAALTAAAELNCPVCLRVPFAAASSLGPAVARAMLERALEERAITEERAFSPASRLQPGPTFQPTGESGRHQPTWELDCGDGAGLALQALRVGVPCIRINAGAEVDEKLAEIASRGNAIVIRNDPVVASEQASAPLDLAGCADAAAACRRWLGERMGNIAGKTKRRPNASLRSAGGACI